ncbi:MAG TPA: hypothetical protein VM692_06345, partial [Gammaproteobacteria bacterium]|nr:hypothetical protein [Gammaproteobacteria bacterium]
IGDAFVVVGLALRHQPSGLEIDLGGPVYFPAAETASHHGVDGARVLHVAWRPGARRERPGGERARACILNTGVDSEASGAVRRPIDGG